MSIDVDTKRAASRAAYGTYIWYKFYSEYLGLSVTFAIRLGSIPSLAALIRTPNGKCPSLRCHAISSCLGVKVDGREEGICNVGMGRYTGS